MRELFDAARFAHLIPQSQVRGHEDLFRGSLALESGIVPAVAGTRAILLMGPTATGKSDAALRLAQALDGEIISVDSALVYRGMDVGTAKPDAATLRAVPHHLINIRDPDQNYSCAAFRRDALECIAAVARRGRIPILTGGTMLYFKALTQGLSALPEANAQLRAQITERAQRLGWPALHAELAQLDPVSARRLAPNDAQRIQRALEVYYLSGAPMSAQLGAAPESTSARVRYLRCALLPGDRTRLHERIAVRFDAMLAAGLVEEVRALRARYRLDAALPAMRCVGYRQVWRYLEGEIDHAAMRAQAIAATRQLAKRQMTWLRGTPQLRGFDCFSPSLRQDLLGWARGVLESAGGEPSLGI